MIAKSDAAIGADLQTSDGRFRLVNVTAVDNGGTGGTQLLIIDGAGLSAISNTIALGGTPDAVEAFAKGFNAAYAKVQQGDSYTIDHTVHGYLLDRDWIKQGTIYAGADSNRARVATALNTLLDGKPLKLPKSARAQ